MFKTRIHTFASAFMVSILGIVLLMPTFAFAQDLGNEWSIEKFDVIIDLLEDGSLDVTEEITVDFIDPRHGIFREIPTTYRDKFNNKIKIHLDIIGVLKDGEPVVYEASPQLLSSDVYIKIGSPIVEFTGTYTYVINYTVEKGVLFFDDFDEVYWNVTGTAWDVPIKSASAIIRLPGGVEILQTSCYTGEFGSTESDCGVATNNNVAAFAAEDFLTVAVGFPKGVVEEASNMEKITSVLKDNVSILIPFAIMVFMIFYWYLVGRDPEMDTVIAEYEPPSNFSAAYVGVMQKAMVSSLDVSAMIVEFAVKGYLTIDVTKKGKRNQIKVIKLIKKREPDSLDTAHRMLFEMIFKDGATEVTQDDIQRSISAHKYRKLSRELRRYLYDQNIYQKGSFTRRKVLFVLSAIQMFVAMSSLYLFGVATMILFILSAVVTFVIAFLIPQKTAHGTEMVRKVRGYRLYLHTAERYRLEWQGKEGIFEKNLPYAIALGVATEWASVFEGTGYVEPSWYHSNMRVESYSGLVKDLWSITSQLSDSVSPSSGGSSGGGSSGGGMGGGGGGSW